MKRHPPSSEDGEDELLSFVPPNEPIQTGLPQRIRNPDIEELDDDELDLHPHVYLGCGHVVARIGEDGERLPNDQCAGPDCKTKGRLVPLQFSLEPRFFIDQPPATHCFNPCGHVVPIKTAM